MKTLPDNYVPADDCLAGKIIVVTGAGDGIGAAAALTFAKHGATVILLGRTIAKLERVYDEIESRGYPQPAIYPINFEGAVEKDYVDMAVKIEQEYGQLDGLLINAAILGQKTPISNYCVDTWMQVLQINLNSPFMMLKALAPLLEKSGNGSVITTSSSVANEGRAFWGAYSVSKAALKNLTEIVAAEWQDTVAIRINHINPGATRTSMRAAAYPAENPAGVPSPYEHMNLYLYLLSDDSRSLTGHYFNAQ